MAKTYHVQRADSCNPDVLADTLNRIQAAGGTILSVVAHGGADNKHDERYCVIDIIYTTGA